MAFLHGRNLGPLLTMWAAAFVFAGSLYWLQSTIPAFDDLLFPIYVVVALLLLIGTIRWFRGRNRLRARRHGDRRHGDRRSMYYDDDRRGDHRPQP